MRAKRRDARGGGDRGSACSGRPACDFLFFCHRTWEATVCPADARRSAIGAARSTPTETHIAGACLPTGMPQTSDTSAPGAWSGVWRSCRPDRRQWRDRAVIAVGFAGALRRSELVALPVADIAWADDGCRLTIRRSKTDQTGEGQVIPIPRGYRLRPVATVQARLQADGITESRIFRAVHRGGAGHAWGCSGNGAGGKRGEAARQTGRAGPGRVQWSQPAVRVPDQRGRSGCVGVQDDGQPASEHAAFL